jgi:hypothetical protein
MEARIMSSNTTNVKIFIMPQQFPCGPEATCCGPIGQPEQEIQKLKSAIEKEIGPWVEVLDVTDEHAMERHPQIAQLFSSLGMKALPIITINEETVSMGNPSPGEAVSGIREKMNQM